MRSALQAAYCLLLLLQIQVNTKMKTVLLFLLLSLPITATGGALPVDAKEEISHLFSYLETSGCEFYRNGSWHTGKDASAHLKKKYQYLLDRKLVSSAESFIERAAKKSSMSGQPYMVRCDKQGAVESGAWFSAELARYRQRSGGAATQ